MVRSIAVHRSWYADLRGAHLRRIEYAESLHGITMTLDQIADFALAFTASFGIRIV
ncbi:hypothetical protein [Bifidobacterium castoris]|uniref:hypothetical protein n=1 Tax=Bifidobacterium castoris TaxID=2306972 RepID=UPI0013DE2618|nr:hypothetical protein [Bifidobacterium castoris]